MEFFAKLGALVEARFREHNFDEASFPEAALESLRDLPPAEHLDSPALIRWALSAPRLPPQDLSSGFGEPPLTLYVGRRFYIEALFWLDGTTSIHQHAFSGAFHVLAGASLHSRYAFHPRVRINSRLLVGDTSLIDVAYLQRGDSQAIRSGRSGLVHSLFHLEQPSVTIVIRTPIEPDALPQYRLRRPSLAQASFTRDERTTRQLQLLDVLRNLGHPDQLPLARELLTGADFETAFAVLDHLNPHLEPAQLTELLAPVHERHGALAQVLPPVLEEERRQAALVGRRRAVKQGDHRFFLALLLNLPHRQAILDQVRLRYGGDPIEWCVRCVEQMASLPATLPGEPNVLGFRMSEVGLLVFRGLIELRSFDEVKALLLEDGYGAEDIHEREDELRALYEGLRQLYLFRTLFQDERA